MTEYELEDAVTFPILYSYLFTCLLIFAVAWVVLWCLGWWKKNSFCQLLSPVLGSLLSAAIYFNLCTRLMVDVRMQIMISVLHLLLLLPGGLLLMVGLFLANKYKNPDAPAILFRGVAVMGLLAVYAGVSTWLLLARFIMLLEPSSFATPAIPTPQYLMYLFPLAAALFMVPPHRKKAEPT